MSSQLFPPVEALFYQRHMNDAGMYMCAGYKRPPHGPFGKQRIQIDHIYPEAENPDLVNDIDNLQPLCYFKEKPGQGCHKVKSKEEQSLRAAGQAWKLRAPRHWRKKSYKAPKRRFPWYMVPPIAFLALFIFAVTWVTIAYTQGIPEAAAFARGTPKALAAALAAILIVRYAPRLLRRPKKKDVAAGEPVMQFDGYDGDERILAAASHADGFRGPVTIVDSERDDAGRLQRITLAYDPNDDPDALSLPLIVGNKTGARWRAEWERHKDQVTLVRRPDLPERIDHPGFAAGRPYWSIPLSPEVSLNLQVTPHVLICGETGSGKTSVTRNAIEAFLDSASRDELDLILLDPKRIELIGYRGVKGVTAIASSGEAMTQVLLDARAEMRRRYELAETQGLSMDTFKPRVIVIEEVRALYAVLKDCWVKKPGQQLPPAIEAINEMLMLARTARIHIIANVQRPDSNFMGGAARDQYGGRVGVGRLTQQAALMVFGDAGIARDVPKSIKGRITVQVDDADPIEDQAYWMPPRVAPVVLAAT